VSAWRSTGILVAAAAVLATTGAARMPDGARLAYAASAIVAPTLATTKPAVQLSGNVQAIVPVAAFGPADGAPNALVAGRAYPIVITVWVAATSGPALVYVVASSGRLIGTTHTTVRAGVTRLHYALVVPRESGPLTIAANTHTHDGGTVTAAYNHSSR
jgi:hypothetical protein